MGMGVNKTDRQVTSQTGVSWKTRRGGRVRALRQGWLCGLCPGQGGAGPGFLAVGGACNGVEA